MARYIDADIALKKMNNWHTQERLMDCVRNTPTADVAPKSEVERWRRQLEAVLDEIPETKREVAREIIDEAIQAVYSKIDLKIYSTIGGKPLGDGVAFGKQQAMYEVISLLAELKKKYTEEK